MSLQDLIKRLPLSEVARIANDQRKTPFRFRPSCTWTGAHITLLHELPPGENPVCTECGQPVVYEEKPCRRSR